jgi:hypothetical protein
MKERERRIDANNISRKEINYLLFNYFSVYGMG